MVNAANGVNPYQNVDLLSMLKGRYKTGGGEKVEGLQKTGGINATPYIESMPTAIPQIKPPTYSGGAYDGAYVNSAGREGYVARKLDFMS